MNRGDMRFHPIDSLTSMCVSRGFYQYQEYGKNQGMVMKFIREAFASILYNLWKSSEVGEGLDALNAQLRTEFLMMGSETEDNIESISYIEYGLAEGRKFGPESIAGLKLKGTNVLVSELIHYLEEDEIYEYLSKSFPDLTRPQIEAALRMATMTLIAFERPLSPQN
jgi:hypothetical protein